MKVEKSERREQAQHKARSGMRIRGRSIFVLKDAIIRRATLAQRQRHAAQDGDSPRSNRGSGTKTNE